MHANFEAMGSATNNKIDIAKENAVGCELYSEEPVIRQCTGKCIKQNKSRASSRKGQAKEDFV